MKSIYSLLLSVFLFFYLPGLNTISQTIKGDGNVVTQERVVPPFRGIIATGSFELFLTQGEEQKIVIEADQNLHNLLISNVRNEMLNVQIIGEVRKAKSLKVFITLVNIEHLIAIGAVDIRTDTTIITERLAVFISGISSIKLNISAKELEFEITDGAYSYLQGEVENFDIRVTDEAEINAFNLIAKNCDAKVSGYSDAKLNVLDEMKLRVTGASNLYYKGNPNITDRIFSGTGFIIKRRIN